MPIYEGVRHMLKFHFVRMVEPCLTGPTWRLAPEGSSLAGAQTNRDYENRLKYHTSVASAATYDWLCGRDCCPASVSTGAKFHPSNVLSGILTGPEANRVAAALAMGSLAADSDRPEQSSLIIGVCVAHALCCCHLMLFDAAVVSG